jgi:Helix-turn-helix domain
MGRKVRAWERAGRPAMWSPGRPPVGRREHRERFWAAIARGLSSEDAGVEAGVSPAVGVRWFREGGGMPSVTLAPASGRYLSFAEREEIAILRARGCGVREIARQLGRLPSTVSRELRRNAATRGGGFDYRASTAQWHADMRARRPKPAKLAINAELRRYVQDRRSGAVDETLLAGDFSSRWRSRRRSMARRNATKLRLTGHPSWLASLKPLRAPKDTTIRLRCEPRHMGQAKLWGVHSPSASLVLRLRACRVAVGARTTLHLPVSKLPRSLLLVVLEANGDTGADVEVRRSVIPKSLDFDDDRRIAEADTSASEWPGPRARRHFRPLV